MKRVIRRRITISGVVQGVGFRPFVARIAEEDSICGSVCNSGGVVQIDAYADREAMDRFICRLCSCAPPSAKVEQILTEEAEIPVKDGRDLVPDSFSIVESEQENGAHLPMVPCDIPVCEDCLAEMKTVQNRRYRYPFISCVNCGPRYSIIERIPYDREHITMRAYEMCPECKTEYGAAGNRRRHAQTISCRSCGPQLFLKVRGTEAVVQENGALERGIFQEGDALEWGTFQEDDALEWAVRLLQEGGTLALKGIGGYQFACRPDRTDAVERLRKLKGREKKPFAVMFPCMESIRSMCVVSEKEEELLTSPARPIVLLERKEEGTAIFSEKVCADSRWLGAFLPYTGLHELLTNMAGPLVMTSANVTGDSILTQEEQMERLWQNSSELLDGVAWNTRRIVTPLDDSLMRMTGGKPQMLRRSRGFVPSPISLAGNCVKPVLAMGGDLKAVFCLAAGNRAYLSQYFGDLENYRCFKAFQEGLFHMTKLFGIQPGLVACDLHPGYVSVQEAEQTAKEAGLPILHVQHHHAHAASVMAEHDLSRCIAVVFDGTGYGTDGHVWGGEFLLCEGACFKRMGHLEEIELCGQDASARDAALNAACQLAACESLRGEAPVGQDETCEATVCPAVGSQLAEMEKALEIVPRKITAKLPFVRKALAFGINTEKSSSMGRLFDAVSAILGIRIENSYEGECAVALEREAWRGNMMVEKNAVEEATAEKAAAEKAEEAAGGGAVKTAQQGIRLPVLHFPIRENTKNGMLTAGRRELLAGLLDEMDKNILPPDGEETPDSFVIPLLAYAFHEAAAELVLEMCRRIREKTKETAVALSGGVFANVLLQERCRQLLEADGFCVYVNEAVPGNDGGISLGQAWIAERSQYYSAEKTAESAD